MITVQISGGLGNQMFQYACGRAVSLFKKTGLKLDLNWFSIVQPKDYRPFQLAEEFNILACIAGEEEAAWRRGEKNNNGRKNLFNRLRYGKPFVFYEKEVGQYDPAIYHIPSGSYLQGYWQCQEYFKPYEEVIRREFTIRKPLGRAAGIWMQKIQAANAASLHVRRGDYVENPQTTRVHGLLSPAYYQAAVDEIKKTAGDLRIFVFSDDIEWCRANIVLDAGMDFVDGVDNNCEELILMSRCKYHVIANSSFSWWGAWLDAQPQKIVIAPAEWYHTSPFHPVDLVPPDWRRIDNYGRLISAGDQLPFET